MLGRKGPLLTWAPPAHPYSLLSGVGDDSKPPRGGGDPKGPSKALLVKGCFRTAAPPAAAAAAAAPAASAAGPAARAPDLWSNEAIE
ncbi:hypothetical protein ACSSS7_001340 [Eimeria intestinalis]